MDRLYRLQQFYVLHYRYSIQHLATAHLGTDTIFTAILILTGRFAALKSLQIY